MHTEDDIVERVLRPPYIPSGEFSCDGVPQVCRHFLAMSFPLRTCCGQRQEVSVHNWKAERTIARTRTRGFLRPGEAKSEVLKCCWFQSLVAISLAS